MASASRDRVTIDLRGIGPSVRAAAGARQITVAAFAREALVEAAGISLEPSVTAGDVFHRSKIVKLTLRLPSTDADLLILKSAALGLPYGGASSAGWFGEFLCRRWLPIAPPTEMP
jgi:hypothetical protein